MELSIIVPVYNVERYLEKCLESLCNQTYKNFEIIIIDDGSTDESMKIIEKYKLLFPKLIKSFRKKNGGLSDARNYGLSKAQGEYVGFVDSDDYIHRDMYLNLMRKAKETDSDVVVCKTIDFIDEEINVDETDMEANIDLFDHSIIEEPRLLVNISSSPCNKIFRRKLFSEILFPKNKIYEDFACIYNVMLLANKIEYAGQSYYFYRHGRKDSITGQEFSTRVFDIFDACKNVIGFYEDNDAMFLCYEEIEYSCVARIYFRIYDSRDARNKVLRWKYINEAFSFMNHNFPKWRDNKYFITTCPDTMLPQFKRLFSFIRTRKNILQIMLLVYPIYKRLMEKRKQNE